MKDDIYKTKACFSADGLLHCSCSCKCGGNLDEKAVCVHVPVLGVLLLNLLLYGLEGHVLIECTSIFGKSLSMEITNKQEMGVNEIPRLLSCFDTTKYLEICASKKLYQRYC